MPTYETVDIIDTFVFSYGSGLANLIFILQIITFLAAFISFVLLVASLVFVCKKRYKLSIYFISFALFFTVVNFVTLVGIGRFGLITFANTVFISFIAVFMLFILDLIFVCLRKFKIGIWLTSLNILICSIFLYISTIVVLIALGF